ncbi:hypothetical protein HSX10_05070 [Winogradskyella undariae]|uniref:hypothetical protein n=1 Tax=Winogradskyella undariae TaxID=1285465 RepID=UPI00156B8722|nr:hypothetical protein [Winogradskyella undariae]NRR90929.1 hypothetical protein [Winogradskyella undariae]
MNISLEQLYGIWRHEHNGVITDFNVRVYDEQHHTGISMFTVYRWTDDGSEIIYEWHGVPEIINYPDLISDISLHHLISTEENLTYQNLKIWHFTNNLMILEFGDGSRVEFQKLGADAG